MARNEILYRGQTYTKISEGNCYLSAALLSDSLEVNTLNFTLKSEDTSLVNFKRYDPVVYSHSGKQVGIFYIDSVKRIAKNQYAFKTVSALGLLLDGKHLGGIYTGVEAKTLIDEICGSVAHVIKNNLQRVKIYGWLPIDSPRNNLARVMFAIGATVKTDLDGVIHIEGLWDGISGLQDRICAESNVDYKSRYSMVSVTEHQYIKDDAAAEEQVFEGSADTSSTLYLSEPYHSYRGEGIAITESGANYAVISGNGKLYAKPYRHSERLVSREIDSTLEQPRVKEITDATLVTLVNSVAVVSRMEAFYKCFQTIEAPAYYNGEKPGDRVTVKHPYDSGVVDAVVQSMDINLSNTLKSYEKMLVGYIPPQIGEIEYFDYEEIISKSGNWKVPDNVYNVTAVLISGGDGAESGSPGEGSREAGEYTSLGGSEKIMAPGYGGKGGKGGQPGAGGKVLVKTFSVTPNQIITAKIGKGGKGGALAAGAPNPGGKGEATTFAGFSSEQGIASGGYFDEVSGVTYAKNGEKGIDGGDGTGWDGKTRFPDFSPGLVTGGNVTDGTETYTPGANPNEHILREDDYDGIYLRLAVSTGFGGGACFGKSGNPGTNDGMKAVIVGPPGYPYADSRAGRGGDGSTPPKAVTKNITFGHGGRGGHGGGGGGGGGYSRIVGLNWNKFYAALPSNGGKGGEAESGADGCVILLYRKPKDVKPGAIRDKNGKFLLDRFKRQMVV